MGPRTLKIGVLAFCPSRRFILEFAAGLFPGELRLLRGVAGILEKGSKGR